MTASMIILLSVVALLWMQPVASLRGSSSSDRELQLDQQDLCASIIAIALTRDPSTRNREPQAQRKLVISKTGKFAKSSPPTTSPSPTIDESILTQEDPEEEFVCERTTTGALLPLLGSDEQLHQLREALESGDLVSAESTIIGLTEEDLGSVELPPGDVEEGNNPFSTNDPNNALKETVVNLPIGELKFKLGNGQNSLKKRALESSEGHSSHRNLAVYTGTKKILFVKVTDKNGLAHPDSAQTMSDKIFGTNGDSTTVKDQFEACSFGDMKVTNDYGFSLGNAESAPGVIEVKINVSLKSSSKGQIQQAAKSAAEAKIGRSLPGPFDHVMFSIEGCYSSCGWAAYAGVNSWFSYYQGNNYKFPAVALHEIGHNLNLAHSGGDDGLTYTDHSCLMGNPWFRDDVSAMCFNPAKSYQLSQQGSWYSDRILTWNSGRTEPKAIIQNIVGIADYNNNPRKYPVVIKLESDSSRDLFVGFNRARGINAASKDAKNMVTVIQQDGNGLTYATSAVRASLSSGQSYTEKNWQGSGKNLVITVRDIVTGSAPWYAEVEFNFDNAQIGTPTPQPTLQPTPRPTLQITSEPTARPNTPAPTKRCGDSVCQADETEESCPADCINAEFRTYTNNVGAKGAEGVMFTLRAMRSIEINSFYTFLRANAMGLVQIYTRQGEYSQFKDSETGWDPVFDETILLNGKDQVTELTFINKVSMTAGQFQSFYVYSPSKLVYRSENVNEGDIVLSDNSLEFFAGIAIAAGKFGDGQVYSPRVFSGIVSYNAKATGSGTNTPSTNPTTPLPTKIPTTSPTSLCGNEVCDLNEHSTTCATDCSNLAYYGADSGNLGAEGIMFSVKAFRNIIVTSFDVYGITKGASLFQVYTKVDSWEGHAVAQANWTLFYNNTNLEQKGRYTLTSLGDFSNGVFIPAGKIQSFYLFTPTKLIYRQGTNSSPYSANEALALYEGTGVTNGLFANGDIQNTVSPRVFAGTIRYDVIDDSYETVSPTRKPTVFPTTSNPTSQPVQLCGNSICDLSEDFSSCPLDCKNVMFNVNEVGGKGAEVAIFSVKALRNITMKSLGFFSGSEKTSNIKVYTRTGPYRGHESSTENWTLVFNSSVVQLGRKNITSLGGFDTAVAIPASSIQSFMIYSPENKVIYSSGTNDTSEGLVFSRNSALEFYEGIGLDLSLTNVYSPRVFSGSIFYDVIAALDTDTCGNTICESYETAITCPSDCENLSITTTDAASKGASGAMFDIKAVRDINVTSLDFFGFSTNANLVQVYTRDGTYSGNERSGDGWELVFNNTSTDIKGRYEATPLGSFSREVTIKANTIGSFYVYSPSKVLYRLGETEGKVHSSKGAVEFFEGIGIDEAFSGSATIIYSPRVFRGVIRYNAI